MPLQIVAHTERFAGRVGKEKRTTIIAIRKSRNPRLDFACEMRRHGYVMAACSCLCLPNPILSSLALFQSFVDAELGSLKIFDPQHEDLRRSQPADGQNPQDQMLSRRCCREQGIQLLQAQKAFAWLLSNLRRGELARGILVNEFLVGRVFKACLDVGANLPDRRFGVTVLCQLVQQQLQGGKGYLPQRLLADERKDVLTE